MYLFVFSGLKIPHSSLPVETLYGNSGDGQKPEDFLPNKSLFLSKEEVHKIVEWFTIVVYYFAWFVCKAKMFSSFLN